jgi:hypothetical protein
VDALEDHRRLERREGDVEAKIGKVPPAGGGVQVEHFRHAGVAGRVAGHRPLAKPVHPLVHDEQPHVGQRVAKRGHLPVHHRRDLVVGTDKHVVKPVVAVHDSRRRAVGWIGREQRVQLVDAGQRAAARRVELLLPTADLPGEEALRVAEVGQPHLCRNYRVQLRERADQALGDNSGPDGPDRGQLVVRPVDDSVDVGHHVERRADHVRVRAQGVGQRNGNRGIAQCGDHPVLAFHVVRGGEHVPERRPAHHPAPGAVADLVREVGPAPRDEPAG